MNRSFCTAVALCVVSAFAAAAVAQDSVIFLDNRDNSTATGFNAMTGTPNVAWSTGGVNAGRRGAGQVLRLEPVHADAWESDAVNTFPNLDGDTNRSTGNLWVYMDVLNDGSGTNGVISSVGLDFNLSMVGTTIRNSIAALGYVMHNDGGVMNSVGFGGGGVGPWNGVANGSLVAGPVPSWADARAVAVPVTTGPVYSSAGRAVPRDPNTQVPYRLGRLRASAGLRNCTFGAGHTTNSSYNVFMAVDSLLITRVFETGGDTTEMVALGYSGASPDAAVSGSSSGATSGVADGVVEIRMKGDFNGDGRVTTADISIAGGMSAAVSGVPDNLLQVYSGDFNGSGTVTSADIPGFNNALQVRSPSCP